MPGRIAGYQGVIGDILRHDSARTNEGIASNGMAADDGAVGPQGGTFFNDGETYLVHLADLGPWVVDVGEHHGRTTEDAVFQGDALVNGDVVLDLAFVADGNVRTDDHVLTDVAVIANLRAGKDVGEVPDLGALADGDVVVDDGGGVDEDIGREG